MNKILYLFLPLLLLNCGTLKEKRKIENSYNKENSSLVENKSIKHNKSKEKEEDIKFELLNIDFKINPDYSIVKNGIYELKYEFYILFKNNNPNFLISYSIYDENRNLILEKKEIKPQEKEKNHYILNDYFIDSLSYNKLLFNIEVKKDKEIISFNKEIINYSMPFIENLSFGPVISFFDEKDKSIKTNLSINLSIRNSDETIWVRLIPPSLDTFWEIPFKREKDLVIAEANLNYKKHPSYLDNGNYIVQINLGKYGIIQKDIKLIDIFNNEKGANYGIPVPSELKSQKDSIILNIEFIDKIDKIEIILFDKEKNDFKEMGRVQLLEVKKEILKKDLIFKDNNGENIKIKNNYKYYYKIIIYTKEINNIRYISLSTYIPITFYGFKFF